MQDGLERYLGIKAVCSTAGGTCPIITVFCETGRGLYICLGHDLSVAIKAASDLTFNFASDLALP
jgi:hypothetical protein